MRKPFLEANAFSPPAAHPLWLSSLLRDSCLEHHVNDALAQSCWGRHCTQLMRQQVHGPCRARAKINNFSAWPCLQILFVTNPGTTPITILAVNPDHGLSFAGKETRTMVWVSFSLQIYSTFEIWRFKFSVVVVPAPSTLWKTTKQLCLKLRVQTVKHGRWKIFERLNRTYFFSGTFRDFFLFPRNLPSTSKHQQIFNILGLGHRWPFTGVKEASP